MAHQKLCATMAWGEFLDSILQNDKDWLSFVPFCFAKEFRLWLLQMRLPCEVGSKKA